MQVVGAAAPCAGPVVEALKSASWHGRAAFVWCDGQDVTGVFADQGDTAADVLRVAAKLVPEVAS